MIGVAGPEFDTILDEVWTRLNVNTDESAVNPSNEALRRGCEALGYRLGVDYGIIPRNARGCASRCDFCFFGCVHNAKQSPLVTYLPDAYHAGGRFLFDTTAERLVIEEGEARGVEAIFRAEGREIPVHVRARAVVAAGSAVQTPALLLRSGVRFRGVGLGLRLDPTTALLAEYAKPIRMWTGPMQTIYVTRFQDSDEGHHGPWIEAAPGHPGLAALALPWSGGRAHKDAMRRIAHAAGTIVLVRDVAEGRVRIDGQGEPVLEYRLTPRDRTNLVRGLQEAARIHLAAGARRLATLHLQECAVGDGTSPISPAEFDGFLDRIARLGVRENGIALFSAHPMGSARAGRDSRTSAAMPTGECHEVRNLWIGDGSLLPTAPGVNPMITIAALAIRTAGFIHERLSSGR
jgi:choline dehydrogenase-like flavoprotein